MDNSNNPLDPNNPTQPQPDLSSALGGSAPQPVAPPLPPPPPMAEPPVPTPDTPIPTWPPNPSPVEPPAPPPSLSSVDNPLNVPNPPPPPTPTFAPPPESSAFNWSPSPAQTPTETLPPPEPQPTPMATEPAPTDLSHLVGNSAAAETGNVYTPPISQPETLVSPSGGGTDMPNIPTENHNGGMPKWVIGIGLGIVLAVIGASAYFILGIGKPQEQTTSLPATTNKPPTLTRPPAPSPTSATSSSTFGQISGGTPAPTSATSAADLLKQRQGR